MALIHKQPVYPKLLKRYHIIFPALVVEALQFCLQVLPGLFHLLYRITAPFLFRSFLSSICFSMDIACRSLDRGILSNWLCPIMIAS